MSNNIDYSKSDDNESIIDSNFITEYENNINLYYKFYKNNVDFINIYLIYLDNDNNISFFEKKKEFLNESILKIDKVISIIKNNKSHKNNNSYKNYKLLYLLKYNFNIDNRELQTFINNPNKFNLLSHVNILNDISFDKTITFFSELNSLYIILKKKPLNNQNNTTKKIIFHSKKK